MSPDEVRAELKRVLASDAFANGGRLGRMLRYVVERTLAGEGDQLKEYVLGVEVFDREETFDPRLDTIVRVEARRLRARLEEYYKGPGASDSVVIRVPRGAYAASFNAPDVSPPEAGESEEAQPSTASSLKRWAALAAVSGAIAVVGLVSWRGLPGTPASPTSAAAVRLAVLPFAFFSTDPQVALLAARLTDGVTTELARQGTLSIVSRTSAAQFVSEERPVSEVAAMLGCDLIMEGSAIVENGQVKVVARLVDGVLDRKVWVGEYSSHPDSIEDLQSRIAAEAGPAALKLAAARPTP